jgi:CHAT domain-containing protein
MEPDCITLLGHDESVYDVAWLPDGHSVVSGGRDRLVHVWDVGAGTRTRTWTLPGVTRSLAVAPDSGLIVAGWDMDDRHGGVTLLDAGRDDAVARKEFSHRVTAAWLDDQAFVVAEANGTIYWWTSPEEGAPLDAHWETSRGTYNMRRRTDVAGVVLASEGGASFLRLDRPTEAPFVFIADEVRFLDVAPGSDRTYAVSAHVRQDGPLGTGGSPDLYEILLWDPEQDATPPWNDSLVGHLSWVRSLDFSPDGSLLSSSGFDGAVFIWDPFSGLQRAELRGHRGAVYWAKFSPDGTRLVTACADGAVRVWSLGRVHDAISSGRPLTVLEADSDLGWEAGPGRDLDLARTAFLVERFLEADDPNALDELIHRSLPFSDATPNLAAIQALNIRTEQARRAGDDEEVAHCRAVQQAIQDHGDRFAAARMGLAGRQRARVGEEPEPEDAPPPPSEQGEAYVQALVEAAASEDAEAARTSLAGWELSDADREEVIVLLAELHEQACQGTAPLAVVIAVLKLMVELLPASASADDRTLCLDMIGSAYCAGGDNVTGSAWLAEAYELAVGAPDCAPVVRALAAEHYGNALRNLGELLPAFDLLEEAASRMREFGGEALIEALINLSVVCDDLGRSDEQLRLLNEAATIAGLAHLDGLLATCLFSLANCKADTGAFTSATSDYQQALRLAIDTNDVRLAAKIAGGLGEALRMTGDPEEAREAYGQAYELSVELNDPGEMAFCLVGQAMMCEAEGKADEARELLRQTLELTRNQVPQRHWTALRRLAALERERDPDTALQLLEEGAAVGERMRTDARLPTDVPETQEKLAATYNERIEILLDRVDAATLFDETERARTSLIVRQLGGRRADDDRPVTALAQALERLSPHAVLLSYYRVAGQLLIFVLRSGERSVLLERRALSDEELMAVDRDADDEIRRPPGPRPRELWTRLAATVLDPVLPLLREEDKLFIAPHGSLHGLPLHALPAGDRRLIERWPVTYLPCASLLETLAPLSPEAPARPAVVGGFFPDEVHDVTRLLGPRASAEGRNGSAKDSALAAFSVADLVHVSGHGFQYPYFPLASGVVLAPSAHAERYVALIGRHPSTWSVSERQELAELRRLADPDLLTVKDIDAMTTSPELVCLSACSSGVVATDMSDEPMGLVPALLRAGARGVAATLWLVDAEVTRSFMSSFYAGLFPTGWPDVARALQQATVATLAEHPHPYYWAPFALIGGLTEQRSGTA